MRNIDLDSDFPRGKHCCVWKDYKIFFAYPVDRETEDIMWGDDCVSLSEATKIQNYAWMEGLAPRVYEIVRVWWLRNWYLAQRLEVLPQVKAEDIKTARGVYNQVTDIGETYGFEVIKKDVSVHDVIQGQLIDFNTFRFSEDHEQKIKDLYVKKACYGKKYYHNVSEWGLTGGPRKNEKRVEWMKLDEIDFQNKSVLDLGCAGGFFCREAKRRGAGKVEGIDFPGKGSPDPVGAAQIASNELGFWDINYKEIDLQVKSPSFKGDVVFFLSMNFHIGIPDWLPKVTNEICIFEDNSKQRNAKETLTKMFKEVKLVGKGIDHGDKPIYHCRKAVQ